VLPPVSGLPASLELVTLKGRVVRPSRFLVRGQLAPGEPLDISWVSDCQCLSVGFARRPVSAALPLCATLHCHSTPVFWVRVIGYGMP
jgi:hypothetical protein